MLGIITLLTFLILRSKLRWILGRKGGHTTYILAEIATGKVPGIE